MQGVDCLKVRYPRAAGWKEKLTMSIPWLAKSKTQKELVQSSCLGLRKWLTKCGARVALRPSIKCSSVSSGNMFYLPFNKNQLKDDSNTNFQWEYWTDRYIDTRSKTVPTIQTERPYLLVLNLWKIIMVGIGYFATSKILMRQKFFLWNRLNR